MTDLAAKNQKLKAIIERTRIDASYMYASDRLAEEKIQFLAQHCQQVLDVGKSSRQRFALFRKGQIRTLDINQYDDYPDILDDLCDAQHMPAESFDAIICLAVLEHVYDPHSAVKNMHVALKPGGYCFAYVPFLYRYHSADGFDYQDYFRYTRDGTAYLFRDFTNVTLYPSRGRYSTMLNLFGSWKQHIEGRFGQSLNRGIDKLGGLILGNRSAELQASGYHIWAVK